MKPVLHPTANRYRRQRRVVYALTTLLILLILTISAQASDWTEADTRRQLYFTIAALGDYGTTKNFTKRYDEGYYESWTPVLGRHPSSRQVDIFFSLWIPGHYLIARQLDADWRPAWQWSGAIAHTLATIHNRSIGLKLEF